MKAPKCMYCGRFIALSEFEDETAGQQFAPDTHFTCEEIEYFHYRCQL